MAAKLARLVYRMLPYDMKYLDLGAKFYDAQQGDREVRQLKWRASKLGFQVLEIPAA